jgi:hypothetical protein
MMLLKNVYIDITIPGRASATPCKQGGTHPAVLFSILGKRQQQEDACISTKSAATV